LSLFGKVEPPPGAEIGLTGNVDAAVKVKLLANDLRDDDTTIDLRSAVTGDAVPVQLTIPIRSLADFKPLHLAANVPEIRRLVLLHRLVLEARNFISSFPELREVIKAELSAAKAKLAADPAARGGDTEIGKLRKGLIEGFPKLIAGPAAK
jgi:predicted component of type VI protein secretion system